jgi:hypothetical protein
MLAAPKVPVYTCYGSNFDLQGTDMLVDNAQVEVEIWQYDPALLPANPGYADPLSVVVSLGNIDEPRIEQAADEIIKGIGVQNG